MPLRKRRNRNRWLSGEQACELLGIEGAGKKKAKNRLAANAERWGIRKIRLGGGSRGTAVYPEIDLFEYMERKEREAAKRIKPPRRSKASADPSLLRTREQKRWLSARAVVYLIGLVTARADDTPEQAREAERRAVRLLNQYAEHWGIRKIDQRGKVKRSLVAYPEKDVLAYMERKEREASERARYMRYYPTYCPRVVGPGLGKWWGDKKLEIALQLGQVAKRTGEPRAGFIKVEVLPDDSVAPLRGYVEAAEVAQRFNIPKGKVNGSRFWDQFCIYLGRPWHSSKRYNGDLIELYFQEKREAGEKVYMKSSLPKKNLSAKA